MKSLIREGRLGRDRHPTVLPENQAGLGEEVLTMIHNVNNLLSILMQMVKDQEVDPALGIVRNIAAMLKATAVKIRVHSQVDIQMAEVMEISELWDWMKLEYGNVHKLTADTFLEGKISLDILAFHQVMDNVFSNAYKYGHPEKSPLEVVCSMREGDLTVEITDNGDGLPAPFQQLARLGARGHRDVPGQGLGLHYCNKTIQAMGGMINGYKTQGSGTKVVIILPVYKSE